MADKQFLNSGLINSVYKREKMLVRIKDAGTSMQLAKLQCVCGGGGGCCRLYTLPFGLGACSPGKV